MKNHRLDKKDIIATWNIAEKGKYGSLKKTRDGTDYVSKIRQLILGGLKRANPKFLEHVKLEKGEKEFKSSFILDVD